MAQPIRYQVPYQIDILAKDLSSGKRIGTSYYLKTDTQTVSPPAYGAVIAGSGSTATLLGNFASDWEALVLDLLSVKYQLVSYTMQAILGYGYQSPFNPIVALSGTGVDIFVQTANPHGLSPFQLVSISGVLTPAGVNGVWPVVAVTGATTFSIASAITGAWTGPGSVQTPTSRRTFVYADKETLVSSAIGGVAGDALPIYADVDVRRLNPGVGKGFRSRFAMTPIGEADNDFGKLNAAAITRWAAGLATFRHGYDNGGSDASSKFSFGLAVSKKTATLATSPFLQSNSWTQYISGLAAHANLGTQLQRKPKLSGS